MTRPYVHSLRSGPLVRHFGESIRKIWGLVRRDCLEYFNFNLYQRPVPSAARMKTLSKGHHILAVLVLPQFTPKPKLEPKLLRTEVLFG